MVPYCWGDNEYEQLGSKSPASANSPIRVPGKLAFKAIAAAMRYTCGITSAGAAYCWGTDLAGELGNGDLVELRGRLGPLPVFGDRILDSITARFVHTCGIGNASKVYCWGSDRYGQLGTGHGGNENSGSTIPQHVALPR